MNDRPRSTSSSLTPSPQAARGVREAHVDPLTPIQSLEQLCAGAWPRGEPPARRLSLLETRAVYEGSVCVREPEPYLPLGKVGLLVAPGGVGKTGLLAQLAVSVASGLSWLDCVDVARPGRVLVVLGEEDEVETYRRLYHAAHARREELGEERARALGRAIVALPLCGRPWPLLETLPGARAPHETIYGQRLREELERGGPWSLVILDPASRFMGAGDENDNGRATRFVQYLEALTQVPGTPTVLVAHTHAQGGARLRAALAPGRRARGVRARGRRALGGQPGSARGGRRGARGASATVLRVTKSNYGPRGEAIELVRARGVWRRVGPAELAHEARAGAADAASKVNMRGLSGLGGEG